MRSAFFGVLNRRTLLAVLGLMTLVALTRLLSWSSDGQGVSLPPLWLLTQMLFLPALVMLLAAAVTEALLARRAPRRSDWAWRVGMVVLACAGFLSVRMLVSLPPSGPFYWGYLFSRTLLFSLFGCSAYALWVLSQQEAQARQRLLGAEQQRDRLRTQQLEAQLLALNAQIEPHFLFNTLATVKRLVETQPERGRQMLGHLTAYLRAALPKLGGQDTSLREELEAVRHYLELLQMRMGLRLRFDIEAEPELLDLRLPPLVLVTLVENAVKHGLSALPEGGQVRVSARREGGHQIVLEVLDDGKGFGASVGGTGMGLANTRARLLACFGPRARLDLEALARGVRARMTLPLGVGLKESR